MDGSIDRPRKAHTMNAQNQNMNEERYIFNSFAHGFDLIRSDPMKVETALLLSGRTSY
jgi:hypothetical protein